MEVDDRDLEGVVRADSGCGERSGKTCSCGGRAEVGKTIELRRLGRGVEVKGDEASSSNSKRL